MKKTKEEVDYSRGMKSAHCSICKHFFRTLQRNQFGSCELVKGTINVGMWCKLYAAKR